MRGVAGMNPAEVNLFKTRQGDQRNRRRYRNEMCAAPDLERGQDTVHLSSDARSPHHNEPVLPVLVGHEIDVAGEAWQRDEPALGERRVLALGLPERQAGPASVPENLGAIGVARYGAGAFWSVEELYGRLAF
ncbi:MAG TPA: hypothetical protein VH913_10585 [Hyphomicrobiaceae bacterium]|jgi:hypothetical protein